MEEDDFNLLVKNFIEGIKRRRAFVQDVAVQEMQLAQPALVSLREAVAHAQGAPARASKTFTENVRASINAELRSQHLDELVPEEVSTNSDGVERHTATLRDRWKSFFGQHYALPDSDEVRQLDFQPLFFSSLILSPGKSAPYP